MTLWGQLVEGVYFQTWVKWTKLNLRDRKKPTEAPVSPLSLYERKQCEEKDHHDVHWSGVNLGLTDAHHYCLYIGRDILFVTCIHCLFN